MSIVSIFRRAAVLPRQFLITCAFAGLIVAAPCLQAAGTATLVTSEVPGTARSDFFGFVGMKFTVGSNPLTVTALGRYFSLTNSGTHTVKLARVSDGADVPNASVSISMAGGTPDTYQYGTLAAPVVLSPNTSYYLVSEEAGSADLWSDLDTTVVVSPNVTCDGAVFIGSGFNWTLASGPDHAFGPVNLQYALGPSVVLTAAATTLRGGDTAVLSAAASDFSGTITQVEYFEGANKLGASSQAPHQFNWNNVAPGVYQFRAIASNNLGLSATSAVVTVTVLACDVSQDFLTDYTLGSLRNNFSGPVGMKITVGAEPLLVTELGRVFVTGNSGTHTLKIVRVSDETDVPDASVEVGSPGTELEFAL